MNVDGFKEIRGQSLTEEERNFENALCRLSLKVTGTLLLEDGKMDQDQSEDELRPVREAIRRSVRMVYLLTEHSTGLFLTNEGNVVLGIPHRPLPQVSVAFNLDENEPFLSGYPADNVLNRVFLSRKLPYGMTLFRVSPSDVKAIIAWPGQKLTIASFPK